MFLRNARKKIKYGPFIESSELMNPIGCGSAQLADLLEFCGISNVNIGDDRKLFFYKHKKPIKQIIKNKKVKSFIIKTKKRKVKEKIVDPDSPFAVLQKLL